MLSETTSLISVTATTSSVSETADSSTNLVIEEATPRNTTLSSVGSSVTTIFSAAQDDIALRDASIANAYVQSLTAEERTSMLEKIAEIKGNFTDGDEDYKNVNMAPVKRL